MIEEWTFHLNVFCLRQWGGGGTCTATLLLNSTYESFWCAGEPGAGAADRPAHTGDPGATEAAAGDAHSQDQAGGQSFFPFAIF